MNLFICSTAYQLLNILCIAEVEKTKPDLIIVRRQLLESCDVEYLKNTGLFSNIYEWPDIHELLTSEAVRNKWDLLTYNIRRASCCLYVRNIWKKLPNRQMVYEKVYVGYADLVSKIIFYWFKKTGSKLGLFDEGTYTYGCLLVKEKFIKKIANYMLFLSDFWNEIEEIYVRRPEKIKLGSHTGIKLKKISNVSNDSFNNILFQVYKANNRAIAALNKPIIFFDQNLETNNARKCQEELLSICGAETRVEDVAIKLHPASRNNHYSQKCVQYNERVPFEVIMNAYSMNKKIFISVFSSACFAPKLLMNQEPYIVLTYKIMKPYFEIDNGYLNIIEEIRGEYIDKNKIIVPETIDEFKTIINKIYKKI